MASSRGDGGLDGYEYTTYYIMYQLQAVFRVPSPKIFNVILINNRGNPNITIQLIIGRLKRRRSKYKKKLRVLPYANA